MPKPLDLEQVLKLGSAMSALVSMHDQGQVGDSDYHRLAVEIACGYHEAGDLRSAVSVLKMVPTSYYDTAQVQHLHEDPKLRLKVVALAEALVRNKLVNLDNPVAVTQAPGKA